MKMKGKVCELCNQPASLYCSSDSAFLCSNCDATVHRANFLVARHLRHILCSTCHRFTGVHVSGAVSPSLPSACCSCSPGTPLADADPLPSSSSSSSACVSTSEARATPKEVKARSWSSSVTDEASPAAKRRRRNAGSEAFGRWSRELGLGLGLGENGDRVASHALSLCVGKWRRVPLRVATATSFWLGLRFSGDRSAATCQNLLRLEAISGVPAKLILAAHAKLARVFTLRRESNFEEGWDESC